jgi:hypothetical protein
MLCPSTVTMRADLDDGDDSQGRSLISGWHPSVGVQLRSAIPPQRNPLLEQVTAVEWPRAISTTQGWSQTLDHCTAAHATEWQRDQRLFNRRSSTII